MVLYDFQVSFVITPTNTLYAEINVLSEGSSANPSMISCHDPEAKSERAQTNAHNHQHYSVEAESDAFAEATFLGQNSVDSIVLICCEDALHLYSLKSLIKVLLLPPILCQLLL